MGIYAEFYNVLINVYGSVAGQPDKITNANYWLAWSIVTFVFVLVFLMCLFGIWLCVRAIVVKKKKTKRVDYYYHKDIWHH